MATREQRRKSKFILRNKDNGMYIKTLPTIGGILFDEVEKIEDATAWQYKVATIIKDSLKNEYPNLEPKIPFYNKALKKWEIV